MSEHTPGPWRVCQTAYNDQWYPGRTICADLADGTPYRIADTALFSAEPEVNARRIVACVNYCEGVSTAEIETAPAHLRLRDLLQFIDSQAKPPLEVTEEHREQGATDMERAYPRREHD